MEGAWMGSWLPDLFKTLSRGLIAIAVVAGLQVPASVANAQDELAQRWRAQQAFSDLVVRVLPQRRDGTAAPAGQGFGIIVAQRGQELIIATPRHVVFDDALNAAPNVRFRVSPNTDVPATRIERSSPQDDLAWLTARAPAGMQLPFAPIVSGSRLTNRWAWAIGHGEAWAMSPRGGTFEEEDTLTRMYLFNGLDVIPGSSGGAIVTPDGVAAMILRTSGVGRVTALPMQRIQQVLPRFVDQTQPLLGASADPSPAPTPAPTQVDPPVGQVLRDCPDCPEMVVITAGTYLMGSPAGEAGRENDEGPQRRVSVPSLAVGRFEVTRGQFAAFQRAAGRNMEGGCNVRTAVGWEHRAERSWRNPGFAQTDEHPATCVSWDDAGAYVGWLSERTGRPYRLLTAAEWEYAARAGTTTAYFFGNNADDLCRFGNGADLAARRANPGWTTVNCDDGHATTAPVGRFTANAFGLFDMHGNVSEWVRDCWAPSYAGAPTDGKAVEPAACTSRVLRGGSWNHIPRFQRSASFNNEPPGFRASFAGFRIARQL
jgi:formylglycine-generating enzyme required for sulfatase activity